VAKGHLEHLCLEEAEEGEVQILEGEGEVVQGVAVEVEVEEAPWG
jgi:hypothetical protein